MTAERNDSVAQFDDHKDSVYCVDSLPVAPFNVFASGDGADKAYVWRLVEKAVADEDVKAEETVAATTEAPEEEKKEV